MLGHGECVAHPLAASHDRTTRCTVRIADGCYLSPALRHVRIGRYSCRVISVNGLEPAGIRWIRGLLRAFAADGGTVLLSSHLLREVEAVADALVIIGGGRVLVQAAPPTSSPPPARRCAASTTLC